MKKMTSEKALAYFKRRKEQFGLADIVQEAEDCAIKALEKEIQQKPLQSWQPCFYWCPQCNSAIKMSIEHSAKKISNCPFCGQALDWREER